MTPSLTPPKLAHISRAGHLPAASAAGLSIPLRVLDLFSGIGGFSLGLERTGGFQTVAFCEIEEFPRRVLKKHWPEVPCYHDVRELTADTLARDGIAVDVICGGFPCQDISTAGRGAGIEGERSGLWAEYARLIGELRPLYVVVENVAALLGRGLDRVLGDLAALGYDAEWHCIPASAVGAPHRRDRIWIVAHAKHDWISVGRRVETAGEERINPARIRRDERQGLQQQAGEVVAYPLRVDVERQQPSVSDQEEWTRPIVGSVGPCGHGRGRWEAEPDVGRVAHGVPDRAHRLKGLGNAVVPQIPELIGNAILQHLEASQ